MLEYSLAKYFFYLSQGGKFTKIVWKWSFWVYLFDTEGPSASIIIHLSSLWSPSQEDLTF